MIEPLEPRIAPATFTVTSLADDGTEGTLRAAVLRANVSPGADTIVFKTGLEGVINLAPTRGSMGSFGPLTVKGPGADKIAISGQDSIRIFTFDDGEDARSSPTTVSGVALVDGRDDSFEGGGAIKSKEPLTLVNVIVASSSTTNGFGGGVWVGTNGNVVITGSKFIGNSAEYYGGGLYLSVGFPYKVTISKSQIVDNLSLASEGGGIALVGTNAVTATIRDTLIAGNFAAEDGGGIWSSPNNLVLKNSTVTGNFAIRNGGGIAVEGSADITLSGSTISGNTAGWNGGGVSGGFGGKRSISKSLFTGNRATDLGNSVGGALDLGFPTAVAITGCRFIDNTSDFGGAIHVGAPAYGSTALFTISGNLFDANSAMSGGAIIASGSGTPIKLFLTGNVFTANHATDTGGALHLASANATISGGRFVGNQADNSGGAIATAGTGLEAVTLTVTGTLFHGNLVGFAGGGALHQSGSGSTLIKNSRFIDNLAFDAEGGAVYANGTGLLTVTGSLFRGNVADGHGGALSVRSGNVKLSASTFLDNAAGASPGVGGGAIALFGGTTEMLKLSVTGNTASAIGGGIYRTPAATATLDMCRVLGNYAPTGPNLSGF